jgi:hypothetical protein
MMTKFRLNILTAAVALLAISLPVPVFAGEAWSCQGITTGIGIWKVQGNNLVEPRGDVVPVAENIPIVKNNPNYLIAMTNGIHDRFDMVMIDKHTLVIRVLGFAINSAYEDHVEGKCASMNQPEK